MQGFWRRRIPFAIILVFLGLAALYISHFRGRNSPPILVGNGESHWVLTLGKEGADYLIHDPLGDGRGLEPLSKYDSDIFGVRIIRQASQ